MKYVTIKTFCDSMELTPEESKYILNYVNERTGGERCTFSTSVSLEELVDALDDLKKSDVYGSDYVDPNDPEDAWNPSQGLYPKQYESRKLKERRRTKEFNNLEEALDVWWNFCAKHGIEHEQEKKIEYDQFYEVVDLNDTTRAFIELKWEYDEGSGVEKEIDIGPREWDSKKSSSCPTTDVYEIGPNASLKEFESDLQDLENRYINKNIKESKMNFQWSSRKNKVRENFDEEYGEDIDNMHKVKELFKQELWHPTENHSKQMKQAMAYVVHFIRESEQKKKKRV